MAVPPTGIKMSLSSILSADAIDSAIKDCQGIIFYQYHYCSLHSIYLKQNLHSISVGARDCFSRLEDYNVEVIYT